MMLLAPSAILLPHVTASPHATLYSPNLFPPVTASPNQSPPLSQVSKLKTLKGLSLQDIVTEIHSYIHKLDLPGQVGSTRPYLHNIPTPNTYLIFSPGADPPSDKAVGAGGPPDGRGKREDPAGGFPRRLPGTRAEEYNCQW